MKRKNGRPLRKVFAANLKATRIARGMSQETLADKANLHRTYIGAIENDARNITLDNVERLARALDVDPVELLRR